MSSSEHLGNTTRAHGRIAAGLEGIRRADANGRPTETRAWTYDGAGLLVRVTDPTAAPDGTPPATDEAGPPSTAGPVIPAAGIGQGVREHDAPLPAPTPAERMRTSVAALLRQVDLEKP